MKTIVILWEEDYNNMEEKLIKLIIAICDCEELVYWDVHQEQNIAYIHLFREIDHLDLNMNEQEIKKIVSINYDFFKESDWSWCKNQKWLQLLKRMESIKKEDVLPKREIVHDTTLLLNYLKLCPKLALYFPEEWITEKKHIKELCLRNICAMEYVDLKKIDVSLLLELMNESFENARYIALRLEGYNDEKISVSEKNGSEIAKEVAEAPEVMKLRMDTLKKVLQFEDPTIFCRFSEQTRNKKGIYSIALKRMPELKVYVNQ